MRPFLLCGMQHAEADVHLMNRTYNKDIMKKLSILLGLMLLLQPAVSAQEKDDAFPRHGFKVGVAGVPVIEGLMFGRFGEKFPIPSDNPSYIYSDYEGPRYMLGHLTAEYSYNCSRKFTLAAVAYMSGMWKNVYDYKGNRRGRESSVSVHILPTARFKYLDRPACTLYGSVGIGAWMSYDDNEFMAMPSVQVVPLGVTFGRKLYGFAESGFGMAFIGWSVGVGYRF